MKTYNYEICESGNIISKVTGNKLAVHIDKKGYHRVRLKHGDGGKTYLLHRVIAIKFIPNPDNLPQINHLDGDKSNNSVSNLEWTTCKKNVEHSVVTGLVKRGSDRPNAKFTDKDILVVRELKSSGYATYSDLAKVYNCSYQTIYKICKRQTYTHI